MDSYILLQILEESSNIIYMEYLRIPRLQGNIFQKRRFCMGTKRRKSWFNFFFLAMSLALLTLNVRAEGKEATITVTAKGTVKKPPDVAYIHLQISAGGSDLHEAWKGNTEKLEKVLKTLIEAEVKEKDIKVSPPSIVSNQQLRRIYGGQPPAGVVGLQTAIVDLTIIVHETEASKLLKRTSALLGIAIKAGAEIKSNSQNVLGVPGGSSSRCLTFSLENKAKAEAEAISQAVKEAKLKAEAAAHSLGKRLGEVKEVSMGEKKAAQYIWPYYNLIPQTEESFEDVNMVEISVEVTVTYVL